MNLPLPLALALQQGINILLKLDPHSAEALQPLSGSVLQVAVTDWGMEVAFNLVDGDIQLLREFDGEADATISGKLASLLSLMRNNDAVYRSEVQMEGDLAVAMGVRDWLSKLDIDWEETISHVTGDAVAHQMGRVATDVFSWLERASQSTQYNVSEYLVEEAEWLAPQTLVESFNQDVDDLRADVDRLAARIKRLSARSDTAGRS